MTHSKLRKGLRATFPGLLLLTVVAASRPAHALSDDERAGARAAAAEGETAFNQKRWSDAVDFFRRAEAIVHSPVHLLYIAQAQIELGQLVEAREALIKIANEEAAPGTPSAVLEARREAERLLPTIEPRLAYITVVVEGEAGSAALVKMDGEPVPPTLLGVPRPVNPGEHRFVAKSDGMESDVTAVSVTEGGKERVVLALHPAAAGASPSDANTAPSVGAPAGDTGDQGGMNGMKIGGFVGLGVGVVGLGLGTVFLVMSSGTQSDADDLDAECAADSTDSRCSVNDPRAAEVVDLDDKAASQGTIGVVGLVVGGIGVATGVTLLVLSGSKSEESARSPFVLPFVGYREAGVFGRF